MDEFIGTIKAFGFNFAPRGWAKCEGQLLPISQYNALFSLLGTTYGGDGRTTFGLPDLRGRVLLGDGDGPGLSPKKLGEKNGSETNTINLTQVPPHNHEVTSNVQVSIAVNNNQGEQSTPSGNFLAKTKDNSYIDEKGNNQTLEGVTVSSNITTLNNGGGKPVNNMQPFLTGNYCICLLGIFPSRN